MLFQDKHTRLSNSAPTQHTHPQRGLRLGDDKLLLIGGRFEQEAAQKAGRGCRRAADVQERQHRVAQRLEQVPHRQNGRLQGMIRYLLELEIQ